MARHEKEKCGYCDGVGEIESDNNGPMYNCPICKGSGLIDITYIEKGDLPENTCEICYHERNTSNTCSVETCPNKLYTLDQAREMVVREIFNLHKTVGIVIGGERVVINEEDLLELLK